MSFVLCGLGGLVWIGNLIHVSPTFFVALAMILFLSGVATETQKGRGG